MDSLPLEIVSEIVDILSYDSPGQLRCYATISTPWQSAVERRTFRSLKFNMTEIETFHQMFNSHRIYRAQFLLELTIALGTISKAKDMRRDETDEGSKAASLLINALADISSRATNVPYLVLTFTDCAVYNGFGYSDIILSNLDPLLENIRSLDTTEVSNGWKSRAPLNFACKLRGVESFKLVLHDDLKFGRRKRMLLREEFGEAVCNLDVSKLHTLTILGSHSSPVDEDWDTGSLFPKSGSYHDIYVRIHQHLSIAPNLKVLRLVREHVIGADLFAHMPIFPSLVEFELVFSAVSADGRWFFVNDGRYYNSEREQELEFVFNPGVGYGEWEVCPIITFEDSDDEDGPLEERDDKSNLYRTLPNPEIIPGFLSDAAAFVRDSPKLQKFLLGSREDTSHWQEDDMNRVLEIWFLRSGVSRPGPDNQNWARVPAEEKILDSKRLYWRVGDRWRPDDAVMQAWNTATGPGTKVFFLDENRWKKCFYWPVYLGDLVEEFAGENV